ncbi:MAG: hypothetical protein V2A66_04205 [Pseudomonadota bacterium]
MIVFDEGISAASLRKAPPVGDGASVVLFPLMEDAALKKCVREIVVSAGAGSVSCVSSATLVARHVEILREQIGPWAAAVGNTIVHGRSVKRWFLLQRYAISSWWLGLLAERNTAKTDAFLRIAQVHAIEEVLSVGRFDAVVVAQSDRRSRSAFVVLMRRFNVRIHLLKTERKCTRRQWFKERFRQLGVVSDIAAALLVFVRFVSRVLWARIQLGSLSRRLPKGLSPLIVSCFPMLERPASECGIFRNKQAGPLQDKLHDMGKSAFWLLMCLPLEGHTYRSSVKLARSLIASGERLCLLEEFISLSDMFVVFMLWVRQIIVSNKVFDVVRDDIVHRRPIGQECAAFIDSLWYSSFRGAVSMEGILFTAAYRRAIESLRDQKMCIYFSEMHAWERALNAARRAVAPQMITVGYQHSIAPKNLFSYFSDPQEIAPEMNSTDLPLPSIFACCGEGLKEMFERCGYPNVTVVEALRYLYLGEIIDKPMRPKSLKPQLLVAGSVDRTETRATLSLLHQAFPKAGRFDIVCKGHPAMPLKDIFCELEIDVEHAGYEVSNDDIAKCLLSAWVVLVPSSSVSIEALAYGCEVLVPVFPNCINMNPLAETDGICQTVYSAEGLVSVMDKILAGRVMGSSEVGRLFVRKYWNLDGDMKRWSGLLSNACGSSVAAGD